MLLQTFSIMVNIGFQDKIYELGSLGFHLHVVSMDALIFFFEEIG